MRTRPLVLLTGLPGAGKSTVFALLARFYDPQAGAVRIDGVDVRDLSLRSLRSQIAIVTQEIFLFNDTVANNIAYGNIDCPRQQIVSAAQAAYADGFTSALPKGYDTLVGEGGIHLSGGQRQRISIARALINEPDLILADEPTGNLDSQASAEIITLLRRMNRERIVTVVLATHDQTIANQADQVVRLTDGQIRSI